MAFCRRRVYRVAIVKHVLVAAVPPMLQSLLVETLVGCDDVHVIVGDGAGAAADTAAVDVVVTVAPDLDHCEPLMELLWRWPRSRVVVVATGGRRAAVYQLIPQQRILSDVSPQTLLDTIRMPRR